jgi:hypothetical protein
MSDSCSGLREPHDEGIEDDTVSRPTFAGEDDEGYNTAPKHETIKDD